MEPLVLRFIERFLVVAFAGLAVYLGYRLFLAVPEQKNATGEIKLPWSIAIAMSRIGPGAFFALFGVIVLSLSLLRPLEYSDQSDAATTNFTYMSNLPAWQDDSADRADARALLRKEMASLNTIPDLLAPELAENDRNDVLRSIEQVKLMLMAPIWGQPEEGFGEFVVFEQWVERGAPDPPPIGMEGALELFLYGSK